MIHAESTAVTAKIIQIVIRKNSDKDPIELHELENDPITLDWNDE